ncbi:hypothetical protein O9929_28135 [Vibrio lentus]|nr:hypothetical protein [Vibrio lentus]
MVWIIADLQVLNGGGALTEATELSGLFIKEGPLFRFVIGYGQLQ